MNARQRSRRRATAEAAAHSWNTPDPDGVDDVELLEQGEPLVDDQEVEAIRWAGYESAIGEAIAHRDKALDNAAARLDKVMRGAYLEYGSAIDAADGTFAAAHRAAMHAHELARGTR